MRHLHTGRKLGVAPDHRRALLRNLTLALIEKEAIKTTPARAKEIRWFAERIVTLAKRGDLSGRRRIHQLLGSTVTRYSGRNRVRLAVEKVYSDLAPRFKTRPGGYTQILRLAKARSGDAADMCIMRYIPVEEKTERGGKAKAKKAAPEKKAAPAPKKVAAPQDKEGEKAAAPKAKKSAKTKEE